MTHPVSSAMVINNVEVVTAWGKTSIVAFLSRVPITKPMRDPNPKNLKGLTSTNKHVR